MFEDEDFPYLLEFLDFDTTPEYKLTYFNFRGRAEPIRMLFAIAEISYEDVRIEFDQWPAIKNSTPFGALPVLEYKGVKIAQTLAILRFVARQTGYAGPDNLTALKADAICDQYVDFGLAIKPWYIVNAGYAEGDKACCCHCSHNIIASQDALYESVYLPAKAKHFPYFEEALKEARCLHFRVRLEDYLHWFQSWTDWFADTPDLTYVDLFIATNLEVLKRTDKNADKLFDGFPLLEAHYNKLFAYPKLQKYLSERPETLY